MGSIKCFGHILVRNIRCCLMMLTCIQLSAAQIPNQRHEILKQEAILLVTFAAANIAYAQLTSAEDHHDAETMSFLYFIYVSTWLGNVYGFFDVVGWVLDWISNWVFYRKGDSPEVLACTARINELKSIKKKKLKLAAKLCFASAKLIQNNEKEKALQLLTCLEQTVASEMSPEEEPE